MTCDRDLFLNATKAIVTSALAAAPLCLQCRLSAIILAAASSSMTADIDREDFLKRCADAYDTIARGRHEPSCTH